MSFLVSFEPDDLGHAGDEKATAMEDGLTQIVSDMNAASNNVKVATQFTEVLQCHPDVFKNSPLGLTDLLQLEGGSDDYIKDSFLPDVMAMAKDDALPDTNVDEKVPGRALLKHAFFQVKTLKDHVDALTKKHAGLQKRFAQHKESMKATLTKKRSAAEKECRKACDEADPVDREMRLARRNQLNRKRKMISTDKVKKPRCEDNLPEAPSGIDSMGSVQILER